MPHKLNTMMTLRRSEDRGHAEHGWLDARHSFSFSSYQDPKWMGYSALRVINEDRVVPGAGFAPHGHNDMEIITYVLSGSLKHKDSTGGEGVLRHGEVQVMSAGRGIRHSEVNASQSETLHLLQIWIEPDKTGVPAGYQQQPLDAAALKKGFVTVVAPHAEKAQFGMHQNARLSIAWPATGQKLTQALDPKRRAYLHVALGEVQANGTVLKAGDAAMLSGESTLAITTTADAELLLFDLP